MAHETETVTLELEHVALLGVVVSKGIQTVNVPECEYVGGPVWNHVLHRTDRRDGRGRAVFAGESA